MTEDTNPQSNGSNPASGANPGGADPAATPKPAAAPAPTGATPASLSSAFTQVSPESAASAPATPASAPTGAAAGKPASAPTGATAGKPASAAPAAPTMPAAGPAAAGAQVAAATGRKKILIVEDEKPLAHALELKLNHDGYETATAGTGTEGLKALESGKYDLMLLDLILPEMDGFALLEELKKKGDTTPIVILSNLGQDEDKKRVEQYNIAQYCVKSNMPLAAIVNTIKVLTT